MIKYLVVHAGYSEIQMGLFFDKNLISIVYEDSKKISKNLIVNFNKLLDEQKISLKDLSFIAAHQGPAPFTSLRVTLASINGISFATDLPLIGVNGLEALISEFKSQEYTTIALLNAFAGELYYAISEPFSSKIEVGCESASKLIEILAKNYKKQILLIGNGVELYKKDITDKIKHAIIIEPVPQIASISTIAKMAYEKWEKQDFSKEVMPVYLKKYSSNVLNS